MGGIRRKKLKNRYERDNNNIFQDVEGYDVKIWVKSMKNCFVVFPKKNKKKRGEGGNVNPLASCSHIF